MLDIDIKMIGLDLDGTTLKYGDEFSSRTLEAFRAVKEKGIHVVIATGRTMKSLPPQLFDLDEIEFVVTSNGAHITRISDRKTIYENIITPVAVEKVVAKAKKWPYIFESFIDGTAYIEKNVYDHMTVHGCSFRDVEYVLSTRNPVEDIYEYTLCHKDNIENISITFPEASDRTHIVNELVEIEDITTTSSFINNVEIGGATTSKATALEFLLKQFGLSTENLMACGDSPNDGHMLRIAAIGVAMANSHPYILNLADYVTDTCYEDGVAKAIERFAL